MLGLLNWGKTLINAKDVKDKTIFKKIGEEEEMSDAIETLSRISAEKAKRQAYQRRLDNRKLHCSIAGKGAVAQ